VPSIGRSVGQRHSASARSAQERDAHGSEDYVRAWFCLDRAAAVLRKNPTALTGEASEDES